MGRVAALAQVPVLAQVVNTARNTKTRPWLQTAGAPRPLAREPVAFLQLFKCGANGQKPWPGHASLPMTAMVANFRLF